MSHSEDAMPERVWWFVLTGSGAGTAFVVSLFFALCSVSDTSNIYAEKVTSLHGELASVHADYARLEKIYAVLSSEYAMMAGMLVREDLQPVRIKYMTKAKLLMDRLVEAKKTVNEIEAAAALEEVGGNK